MRKEREGGESTTNLRRNEEGEGRHEEEEE